MAAGTWPVVLGGVLRRALGHDRMQTLSDTDHLRMRRHEHLENRRTRSRHPCDVNDFQHRTYLTYSRGIDNRARMISFFKTTLCSNRFHATTAHALAAAAPSIPISRTPAIIATHLTTSTPPRNRAATSSYPVITRSSPTEPVATLMNCPIERIASVRSPAG